MRDPPHAAITRVPAKTRIPGGTRWLWETVIVAGEVIAVKQIEVSPDGMARCYWWRHLEDERGSLTDQALDPDGWRLRAVGRDTFCELWDSARR